MSYILSALKKAEQERGGASPLTASLLAAEPVRERRAGMVWWLAGALVLVAVVAGATWYLLRPESGDQNMAPVATSAAPPEALLPAGQAPVAAAPQTVALTPPPAVALPVLRSQPAVQSATADATSAASAGMAATPPVVAVVQGTAVSAGGDAPVTVDGFAVTAAATAVPAGEAGKPALSVEADPTAPALPELEISGHIYVEARPAASKLFAAGSAWREGDTLPGGVVVQAIEAEAVVLQYLGREYRVAVK